MAAYREQAERVPFRFESRFIQTAHGETHVLLAGRTDDPPLVVLSGVNFGAFFTTEWVERLEPRFRLIIPDIVGQPNWSAESRPPARHHEYANWLETVLGALELPAVRMLGVSFGGAIVLDLAAAVPARISQAALLVPGGFAGGSLLDILRRLFLPWTLYRFLPRPERLPRIVSPLGDGLPEHWYAFFDLLLRHVHWAVQPPGPFEPEQLAAYAAPTLAIFAQDDCFFPGDEAAAAAKRALGERVTTRVIAGKHIPRAAGIEYAQRELVAFFGSARAR